MSIIFLALLIIIILFVFGFCIKYYIDNQRSAKEIKEIFNLEEYNRAHILINSNNLKEAEKILEDIIKRSPDFVKAYIGLGLIRKRLCNAYTEAIEYCDKALKLDPESSFALYNLACYKALRGDDVMQVINALDNAFTFDPNVLFWECLLRDIQPGGDFYNLISERSFKELLRRRGINI